MTRSLRYLLVALTFASVSAQEPSGNAITGKTGRGGKEPAIQTPGQLGIQIKTPTAQKTPASQGSSRGGGPEGGSGGGGSPGAPGPQRSPRPSLLPTPQQQPLPWVQPASAPSPSRVTPFGYIGGTWGTTQPQQPINVYNPWVQQPDPLAILMSNPFYMMQLLSGDVPDLTSAPMNRNNPLAMLWRWSMIQRMRQQQLDRINRNLMSNGMIPLNTRPPMPPSMTPSRFPTPSQPNPAGTGATGAVTGSEPPPTQSGLPAEAKPPTRPVNSGQPAPKGPPGSPKRPGRPGPTPGLQRPAGSGPTSASPRVPRNMRQLMNDPNFQRMLRTNAMMGPGAADRRADRADMMADYMDNLQAVGPMALMGRQMAMMRGMRGMGIMPNMVPMMPGMSGDMAGVLSVLARFGGI